MKIRRVDFSPDEWLAGIAGMSAEEQGIYWLVCSLIYSSGGPIPVDDERLIALAGCHGNRRNAIIARLVERKKLYRKDRQIGQKRSENELENARKRSENARENVSKRWNNNALVDDAVMLGRNANHQPSSTNIHPLTPSRGNGRATRSRRNGKDDPFAYLLAWTPQQLRKRFNETEVHDPEHEAIRAIIAPNTSPHVF